MLCLCSSIYFDRTFVREENYWCYRICCFLQPLPWKDILSTVTVMAAEVQMVLYEDASVQVQYIDGSRLRLSPCGSEFLFEKAPPVSAHPLQQPE